MRRCQWDRPIPYRLSDGRQYALGVLDALEPAAAKLGMRPEQLRRACDRDAETCGDVAVAHMEAGVVAIRAGGVWRFRFPIVAPASRSRRAR